MKRYLIAPIALVTLLAGMAFAVPRFDAPTADEAMVPTIEKNIPVIDVATTVDAARQAAYATEVAFSPPDKGETAVTTQPAIELQKGIRFTNTCIVGRTGPPPVEKAALPLPVRARYDKPGWIDVDGAVADVEYVRRN